MSSAIDIQIVSVPNLAKIESFFKDVSYRETIEYSANFNTRLCIERRLRLPFLDPQTGVAQNHSQLFVDKRQRMPGFRQGQIYTYPSARWRKGRRQYLNKMRRFPDRPFQALRKEHEALMVASASGTGLTLNTTTSTSSSTVLLGSLHHSDTTDFNGAFALEESSSLGAGGGDTSDSKDSQLQSHHHQHQQLQQQQTKDELPKEWFYDDIDMNDVDSLEDPKSPADDEYDYDPRYGNKKRRKRRAGKRTSIHPGVGDIGPTNTVSRRRSGVGRGRNTTTDATLDASLEAIEAGGDVMPNTPTTTGARRSRGSGVRGRRRAKTAGGVGGAGSGTHQSSKPCDPPSPGLASEPPSFESAAAAVGVVEDDGHLRNYRKYL